MSEFHLAFSNLIEQFITYRIASGTWNTIPLSQDMVEDWCICHPNELNRSRNTRIMMLCIRALLNFYNDEIP